MKSKLILLVFLFTLNCFSQFSKTHYLPPVSSSIIDAGNQYMYISTSSITPVNFSIIQLGTNTPIKGTVSRDIPYEYSISSGNDSQAHVPENKVHQVLNDKGYVIEAEDLVAVSIRIGSGDIFKNHASSIVSKGLAALGKQFRIGSFINPGNYSSAHYTFVSILATENNTRVSFSNIDTGVNLINNNEGSNPSDIILNSGQSFVLGVHGGINSIRDGLIGALVSSDKPIALNCGSFGGTNGLSSNLDMGFDQIVPAERLKVSDTSDENEYIFIKSDGWDDVERVLLIAHENNTEIYLNGNPTPNYTLNAGDYVALNGANFNSNSNLYVRSTKPIFAYQSIGDQKIINSNNGQEYQANQEMFFVPPLSCQTPNNINNIPMIEKLGNDTFGGRITIVTKKGSNLTFKINGVDYTYANVSSSKSGPNPVTGNNDYETYTIIGLKGNISVFSTSEVYIAAYGNNGAATFGGYYSGFTFEPEVTFEKLNLTSENCIPNVKLSVSTATSFDTFEWSFNDTPIGGNTNTYTPIDPGYYKVKASISTCPSFGTLESDEIPVSSCPTNLDNDLVNDNIDIDNDNDGILNCTESFGNQNINTSVTLGTINNSPVTYNSTFSATTTTGSTFSGNSNGSIVTETPAGRTEQVIYKLNFTNPISIGVDYPTTANVSDLLNANAEYTISTNTNKTITVLNPTNQLLIDTNYDGIFESGVTQFSSFEIRFRLNGNIPLASGTGTFKFLSYKITKLEIKHRNLSDAQNNRSTFRIFASCVEKDTDGDSIPDQLDIDSDGDGIFDLTEAQNNTAIAISNTDTNLNGLDNAFEPGFTPFDNDNDGIPDYLDLDSDNDGIRDIIETGNDLDLDGIKNYRDLDSDADDCFDVKEAGFIDTDNDGIFGTSPITPRANGLVNGAPYTTPNNNYLTSAPIVITSQPVDSSQCLYESTTFEIISNADSFQWQLSVDNGITWSPLSDDATYNNVLTNILTINNLQNNMNGYQYRAQLNRNGNKCDFYSANVKLTVYQLPVLNIDKILSQCISNTSGYTIFNLNEIRSKISSNYLNESFSYFHTENGANINDTNERITNFENYTNQTPNSETIWARVTNSNNCFSVVSFLIVISPSGALYDLPDKEMHNCDDNLDSINNDYDGVASFDLTNNYNYLVNFYNDPNIDIKFYKNENDYYQEFSNGQPLAITDLANYRNIGYRDNQSIWVRIENKLTNDCVGQPTTFNLVVEPKPNIDVNLDGSDNTHICTDDPAVFQTLTAGLPATENPNDYTYVWEKDGTQLPDTTPAISVNIAGNYKVTVAYIAGLKCSRERNILVEESNTAQIAGTPLIKDLVDNNSITVSVTGDGNYVFALDDQFGPTQTTGYFENLTPGIHTVFVIDLYGCSVLKVPFSIIGFPEFFTPNGDGYHDTWNIVGANNSFNANTKILIYNRYGKLLKEILPLGNGWDGNYLGKPVPADDYWFTAELKDGRNVKGHFSLKR